MRDADVLRRLEELGLELPPPPVPVASYVPVTQTGRLLFVAGQVPMIDGHLLHAGRLGQQVSVEMGQEAAGRAALQALSAIRDHLGGSLDRLERLLQVSVFVAADAEFVEHPKVANGASDTLDRRARARWPACESRRRRGLAPPGSERRDHPHGRGVRVGLATTSAGIAGRRRAA